MKIEVIDLKKRFLEEKNELMKSIKRVLVKGNLVLTKEVESFEKKICKYVGAKYCLGLNSGTDALMMSLWATGISKGDEVITSPISFIASASSIIHLGAKPVFVDVKSDQLINVNAIKNLTALIVSHRSYEAYQKAVSNYDKMMDKSSNTIGEVRI